MHRMRIVRGTENAGTISGSMGMGKGQVFGVAVRALRMALGLAVCVAAVAHPVAADPSPTGRTPKLFWTPERQAVWNRMRSENHPWWRQIKDNADVSATSSARYADLGQWATMAYQVTGDPVYAQKAWHEAQSKLDGTTAPDSSRNFTREHFIEYAWMYDWLYPGLTASQRAQWIDSLNYWADLCLGRGATTWGTRLSDSDETTGHYFGLVLWDLASAADNPQAGTLIAHSKTGGLDKTGNSRNNMRNAVADYVRRSEGGVWIEASKYNMGSLQLLLMGAEGVKTATGVDHFPELGPFLKDVALAQMHEVTPDLRKAFQWGDNEEPRSLNRDRRVALLAMLAGLLQGDASIGPYINNFRAAIQGGDEPHFRWMILGNPYAASADFRTAIGLGHNAPGMGILLARDTSQSTGSLFASHMASLSTVDHEVHHLSNFDLYRDGEFAVTHVIGYDANEAEHHNSMLLAGLSDMAEARGPVASEIGADGSYAYHVGATGGNRNKDGYYNPPPRFVHEWSRSLLYLPSADQRSDTVVVVDRVNTEDPSVLTGLDRYRAEDQNRITGAPALKQWIIHAPVSPTLGSDTITWQTAGGQTVRVNTLLPLTHSRNIYDEGSMGLKGTIRAEERHFQVRIAPSTERQWDTFLNVVQAYDSGVALTNTLVTSTNGAASGVLLKRPGQPNAVALFNAAQGPDLPPSKKVNGYLDVDPALLGMLKTNRLLSAGYQVTWASDTSSTAVFLADLNPAKQWLITVDNLQEKPLAVSPQGLARLTVSGSGLHVLIVRVSGDVTDAVAPVISGIQVANVTATGALITWTTDESASGVVAYGTTASYGQATPSGALMTTHSASVTGLTAGTTYHFQVRATDAAGNAASSGDGSFTTASAATASFFETGGQVAIEAERFDAKIARGGQDWVFETATIGYEGSGYLRALPNLGTNAATGYVTTSPELVYNVQFATPGTYYVWIRGQADSTNDDSVNVGIDGAGPSTCDRIGDFPAGWGWLQSTMDVVVATLTVPSAGLHTIHVWMRQDGLRVDRILLRMDSSTTPPDGSGPPPTVNQAPVLNAIGAQAVTVGQTLTIAPSAVDPNGDAMTFSVAPLPTGAVMNSPFTWTPILSQAGTYTLTFTVSDGQLTDSEAVTVTVAAPASNQPPQVNAGSNQTITLPGTASLAGTANDDGLPSTGSLSLQWTKVSGPGTVSFTSPTAAATGASFSVEGAYVLRLQANDGLLNASDDVSVTVQAAPASGSLITDAWVVTGERIRVDELAVGKTVFIDRAYTFTSIPSGLAGQPFIRMANDDKYQKGSGYLTFTLTDAATVYVAFSSVTTNVPKWLNSWTKTSQILGTTDTPRVLYRRSYPAGTVTLGGNGGLWKIDAFSQYSVIAVPE